MRAGCAGARSGGGGCDAVLDGTVSLRDSSRGGFELLGVYGKGHVG